MDRLIYLTYPLVAACLLCGMKIAKQNTYHEDFLSLAQAKCLQGYCLLLIMVHHISLKLC